MILKKSSLQPGEKINYTIKSGFDNVWLIHTLTKVNNKKTVSYLDLNNRKSFELPVSEQDRGGMGIDFAFIQHNRVYIGSENFSIPWSNKDLEINYQTFRDKLLPGSKETYTVKVSGNKGDKVSAEILASMYDASLDQYNPHYWDRFSIFPYQYSYVNWEKSGFTQKNSEEFHNIPTDYAYYKSKIYDRLLFQTKIIM
ncbi:MAG: hypothetical protein IPJ81_09760 [Chitinophagaceae bacterium]|nr:hypothetical protein [Chitinophagaceae bacterium]